MEYELIQIILQSFAIEISLIVFWIPYLQVMSAHSWLNIFKYLKEE